MRVMGEKGGLLGRGLISGLPDQKVKNGELGEGMSKHKACGKMAQPLRASLLLYTTWGWFLSPTPGDSQQPGTTSPGDQMPFAGLHGNPNIHGIYGAHRHLHIKP